MERCSRWFMEDNVKWVTQNWKENSDQLEGIEAEEPPQAIRLNASRYVPVTDTSDSKIAMPDYHRHSNGGWDMFPCDFIIATWELPAHHFALFEKDTVSLTSNLLLQRLVNSVNSSFLLQIAETSDKVKRACDLLAED